MTDAMYGQLRREISAIEPVVRNACGAAIHTNALEPLRQAWSVVDRVEVAIRREGWGGGN